MCRRICQTKLKSPINSEILLLYKHDSKKYYRTDMESVGIC